MYYKILIPLDISKTDQGILEHIRPLARKSGAALVLVHVSDGFGARLQGALNLTDSQEVTQDLAYLQDLTNQLAREGFNVHHHLLKGEPVQGILDIAAEEQCDLIAMATHGHRFLLDWIFGSVADGLRHRTSLPILMIRSRAK